MGSMLERFMTLGGGGVNKDPNFKLKSMLLPGNGTNGAQNNTFLDSSSNNFTITRNGNTTQGTFSPFSQTGWSTYFSGSPYLETPSNAAFSWGTGDFSMEFQVYVTTGGVLNRCLHFSDDVSNLAITAANQIELWLGASALNSGSYTVTPNTWAHVVATRVGSTCRLFLNGMLVATTTSSFNKGVGSLQIGGSSAYANDLNGYLAGVRLVKGGVPTAYSTASTTVGAQIFTPPTAAFTGAESLTAGSLSFLGLQQNRWVDISSNTFAITVNGTPSVQAFSPFAPTAAYSAATNGGSGYFDGSGDSISAPNNTAFDMTSSNYCFEAWVYPVTTNEMSVFNRCDGTGAPGLSIQILNTQAVLFSINTTGALTTSSGVIKINAWNHIACTFDGTTRRVFVNGALETSSSAVVSWSNPSTYTAMTIGDRPSDSRHFYFQGFIGSCRIVKGSAVYTAAFTPATSPLTAITNTVLLLNYTNGGITDATGKNVLETVGNAQISTTQSKWGGGSIYLDGNSTAGSGLVAYRNQLQKIGMGDFTVSGWVRRPSIAAWGVVVSFGRTFTAGARTMVLIEAGVPKIYYEGTTVAYTGTAMSANTWAFVTWCRKNGTTYLGIDGNIQNIGTSGGSTNINADSYLAIGRNFDGYFEGAEMYVNDLDIVPGQALYIANFTPPSSSRPLQ